MNRCLPRLALYAAAVFEAYATTPPRSLLHYSVPQLSEGSSG